MKTKFVFIIKYLCWSVFSITLIMVIILTLYRLCILNVIKIICFMNRHCFRLYNIHVLLYFSYWSTCLSLFLKVIKYKCIYSFTCLIQLEMKITFYEQFVSIVNPLEKMCREEQLVLWNPIVIGTASCVLFYRFLLLIERGSGRPYAFSVGLLITAGHQYSIAFFITHTHTHHS